MTSLVVPIADHEHWLAVRKQCAATASTAPALVADHPYETPYSVYLRAIGELPEIDENEAMAAGLDAEAMMPARARRVRPTLRLAKNDDFYVHPSLRFGGTPDFFGDDGSIWQAKCVDPAVFYGAWTEGPPLWVQLQLQAEYRLTGATQGGVLVLIRDRRFTTHLYDVPRHNGAIAAIEDAVRDLEKRVATLNPPPVDWERDAAMVVRMHQAVCKTAAPADLSADARAHDLCQAYMLAAASEAAARKAKDAAKAELLTLIGAAPGAVCGAYTIRANAVAAQPDQAITPEMVGQMLKGRAAYRNFRIAEKV